MSMKALLMSFQSSEQHYPLRQQFSETVSDQELQPAIFESIGSSSQKIPCLFQKVQK